MPYHTYPRIWKDPFHYMSVCLKAAIFVENSADQDRTPQKMTSGLDQHYFLTLVCLNISGKHS